MVYALVIIVGTAEFWLFPPGLDRAQCDYLGIMARVWISQEVDKPVSYRCEPRR